MKNKYFSLSKAVFKSMHNLFVSSKSSRTLLVIVLLVFLLLLPVYWRLATNVQVHYRQMFHHIMQ